MRTILVTLFLAIVLFIGVFFVWNKLTKKPDIYINTSSAAVVKELKSLNRYETAQFTIEKIIDAGTNYSAIKQFLVGDKLLLIAHGQVIAGFDLSEISENNVSVHGSSISLMLPAPKILVTRLDNEKTRVYDRRQGLLSHGNKDLESQARLAAENSIKDAACQEKILDEAAQNAKKQLTVLLKRLGFTTITITIPPGNC